MLNNLQIRCGELERIMFPNSTTPEHLHVPTSWGLCGESFQLSGLVLQPSSTRTACRRTVKMALVHTAVLDRKDTSRRAEMSRLSILWSSRKSNWTATVRGGTVRDVPLA